MFKRYRIQSEIMNKVKNLQCQRAKNKTYDTQVTLENLIFVSALIIEWMLL